MLSATITYQEKVDKPAINSLFIRKICPTHYQIYLIAADKVIGDINLSQNVMTFKYSSELLLDEFIIIHDVISQLKNKNDQMLDDSNSFLGYLPNGESAFIMTNWKPWLVYIQQSMKYCQ